MPTDKDILRDFDIKISPTDSDLAKLTIYERLHIRSQLLIAERIEMLNKVLMRILDKMK